MKIASHVRFAIRLTALPALLLSLTAATAVADEGLDKHLIGHWKLAGDCQDSSGRGNHGVNRGVRFDGDTKDKAGGLFDGQSAYVEVPSSESLKLGKGDFTITAHVHIEKQVDDVIGDVLDWFDPDARRGVTLSIYSSAGGYQSQGADRHVSFGIDNARAGEWVDCGRPSATSNYVNNSLTVFDGNLYAATTDAKDEKDWAHVWRYEGGQRWTDCGRVGSEKTTGVGPMIVHQGRLYVATTTYDWTRVQQGDYDPGRVYRYEGGTTWKDMGRPSENRTLNCIASFQGKLYVGGGPQSWAVHAQNDEGGWSASKVFHKRGPRRCFPHAMCVYNERLFVAFPSAYAFDGKEWTYAGVTSEPEAKLQTHSLAVYQGKLTAGTWPLAKVSRYLGGEKWEEFGRVGEDGTEVNSLVVYNGKLYGGSIPRAEVCRHDGGEKWTSLKRFYSPDGWTPVPPSENGAMPTREELNEWSRVTSMTICDGKLFASTGSCTSSVQDAPADVRGKVFSFEAGKCATFDGDLGAGWKRLAAVREGGSLRLFVDGKLAAKSATFDPADYDLATGRPLRIGFGQTDYFNGRIADVRVYDKALGERELRELSAPH